MIVRRYLHASGLRYRLHDKTFPGQSDLVFPSRRVSVFVHGCFWHQHEGYPAPSGQPQIPITGQKSSTAMLRKISSTWLSYGLEANGVQAV
ncbi:hypothetical protein [Martelella limonii]|uniref:hypothetical protein n=1 Tax=Martelella limonii TaxID=1647649 RepID=UPI001580C8CE